MLKDDTFANFGFFSTQASTVRASLTYAQHKQELAQFLESLNRALESRGNFTAFADDMGRYKGALFWFRALECCQATVMLADMGMQGASFSTLRTAWECLLTAAALWRKPELGAKLADHYFYELDKQGSELKKRAPEMLDDETLCLIKETMMQGGSTSTGWSMFEAATAAGLIGEYTLYWRGASLAGAHATEFSIALMQKVDADGRAYVHVQPEFDQFASILGSVSQCLEIGQARFEEAVKLSL